MRTLLSQIKAHSVVLVNAGSLVGATAVTAGLGFVYWWLAARLFAPEAVGIASALVSAMTLLGTVCTLGLGTLLMGELPRHPGSKLSLINGALLLVGGVGGCAGILFAIVAPKVAINFHIIQGDVGDIALFALGISLTAITLVLDQALLGLLRGDMQLWRNTLFAGAKLAALFVVGLWLSHHAVGMTIYATWMIGNVLSIVLLAGFAVLKGGWPGRTYLPQWVLLRELKASALQHHLLNLALMAPVLCLPVLVTALLSARMNAWFYISWMITSFLFVLPFALTIALYASDSSQPGMCEVEFG